MLILSNSLHPMQALARTETFHVFSHVEAEVFPG
jgi:hypothetical protein